MLMTTLLEDPVEAARQLESDAGPYIVEAATGRHLQMGYVALDVTFRPGPDFAAHGYGSERIRLVVGPDTVPSVRPLGSPNRTFQHRNLDGARSLCLWYEDDPAELKWLPGDSVEQLLGIAFRHMYSEEYFRRNGHWPNEDVPHGRPLHGTHPILRTDTARARIAWRRNEESAEGVQHA